MWQGRPGTRGIEVTTMILGSSNRPAPVAVSILHGSQGTSPLGRAQAASFETCRWATRTATAQHVTLSLVSRCAWFPQSLYKTPK